MAVRSGIRVSRPSVSLCATAQNTTGRPRIVCTNRSPSAHTRSAKQRCRKKREEDNSMHYAKTKRRRKGPAGRTANAEGTMKHPASSDPHHDAVQGEGNYEAAREF